MAVSRPATVRIFVTCGSNPMIPSCSSGVAVRIISAVPSAAMTACATTPGPTARCAAPTSTTSAPSHPLSGSVPRQHPAGNRFGWEQSQAAKPKGPDPALSQTKTLVRE